MDPSSEINPQRPSFPLTTKNFRAERTNEDDYQVKKTDLKESDIPSATSQQIQFPNNPEIETIMELTSDQPFSSDQIEEEIKEQIDVVASLKDSEPKPVHSLAQQILEGTVESGEVMHHFVLRPYDYAIEPHVEYQLSGDLRSGVNSVQALRTVFQSIEFVGLGAGLIANKALIDQINKLLHENEINLENNPHEIRLKITVENLRGYLAIQREAFKQKAILFSASFVTVSLKITDFIMVAAKMIFPFAKRTVGWGIVFLDILWESISLWRAQKAKTTYETWMVQNAMNQRTKEQAEKLLAIRREKMVSLALEKAKKMSLDDLKLTLKKEITSFDDFELQLRTVPSFRQEILENFLDENDKREETINVSVRNGIQSLAEAKVRNEGKFINFRLLMSKLGLTSACVTAPLSIALEVLALVGVVALAASVLALPGLGFFAMGVILTGIGLYYFHKHKPNLFKCLVSGVNMRLLFFQIPAKIRSLQLHRKKEEVKALEDISAHYEQLEGLIKQRETVVRAFIPMEYRKTLEKLSQDAAKKTDHVNYLKVLDELEIRKNEYSKRLDASKIREEELKEKVDAWLGKEGVVTKLQNQITEAANKDFARANRLVTTALGNEINIPLILVGKILDPENSEIMDLDYEFDEETLKVIKEKMGIDLEQIPGKVGKQDKEEIIKKLKEFFQMDDAELLLLMKQQINDFKKTKPPIPNIIPDGQIV